MRCAAVAVGVVLLLGATAATAHACVIPFRSLGPIELDPEELKVPQIRPVARAQWGLGSAHVSTRPRLAQFVRVIDYGTVHGATFAAQQALSIDGIGPPDRGWKYVHDDNPDTPACKMVGRYQWQTPRVRMRQSKDSVRIAVTTLRTVGDRTGCVLGPDLGLRPCPNLTRAIVKLAAPLGDRPLYFDILT